MSHPERVEDYLEHIADAIERAIRYVGSLKDLAVKQDLPPLLKQIKFLLASTSGNPAPKP